MQFKLDEATQILKRTPATLKALLSDLDPSWIAAIEGEESWSTFDIVGHLTLSAI